MPGIDTTDDEARLQHALCVSAARQPQTPIERADEGQTKYQSRHSCPAPRAPDCATRLAGGDYTEVYASDADTALQQAMAVARRRQDRKFGTAVAAREPSGVCV